MKLSHSEKNADALILQRIDDVCAGLHTTRADVLRALVFAQICEAADVKPWKEPRYVMANNIMWKMHQVCSTTVHNLRCATHVKGMRGPEWEVVLQGLCHAGHLHISEEKMPDGNTKRIVRLQTAKNRTCVGNGKFPLPTDDQKSTS